MNSPAFRYAIGSAVPHNPNTFTARLFSQRFKRSTEISRRMESRNPRPEKTNIDYIFEPGKEPRIRRGGHITLTVCGTGGYGTPRSIFLTTEHYNYIFNCGEGFQRASQEYRLKLARLHRAFITSSSWKNVGGLIGLGLTVENTGASILKVHCPKILSTVLDANNKVLDIANVQLRFAQWEKYKKYSDKCITIWHIPIVPDSDRHVKKSNASTIETVINNNGKRTKQEEHYQEKLLKRENDNCKDPPKEVLCYICKLKDREGSLNLSKCIEYGVQPGPILGKLKSGKDVTLEDGTIIRSSDVCDAPITGPIFIVVEVPSKAYLKSFLDDPVLKKNQGAEKSVAYVIHFTPMEIVQDPLYIEWMSKFSSETEHVLIDERLYTISSEAIVKNQYLLNLIHPKIFSCLPQDEDSVVHDDHDITDKEGKPLRVSTPNALEEYFLFPHVKRSKDRVIKLCPDEYIKQLMDQPEFREALTDVRRKIDDCSKSLPTEDVEYPKIIMLGTGCSVPCKYRNTSGILLQTNENNNILLDCGEGILGQIQRRFTTPESDSVLRNLRGIFISHLHADHHLGLFSILIKRATLTEEPIYVIGPERFWAWMQQYNDRIEEVLKSVHFYSNSYLDVEEKTKDVEAKNLFFGYLNISSMYTTKVRHPGFASGVSIVLKNGKKITYSGDTMPSENLISLGSSSDLLIHEATMDDSLENRAKRSYHTTTSQAINVGREMNARFTLLTHFSQRYAKLPYFGDDINGQVMNSIGVAFDFMEITLPQLKLLPIFYPALMVLFAESTAEHEQRAIKNRLRQESEKQGKQELKE